VAKFHGDRPTKLGDFLPKKRKDKKRKETPAKYKPDGKPPFSGGLIIIVYYAKRQQHTIKYTKKH